MASCFVESSNLNIPNACLYGGKNKYKTMWEKEETVQENTCHVCGGKGYSGKDGMFVGCKSCNGSGYDNADTIDVNDKIPCNECGGTGRDTCSHSYRIRDEKSLKCSICGKTIERPIKSAVSKIGSEAP